MYPCGAWCAHLKRSQQPAICPTTLICKLSSSAACAVGYSQLHASRITWGPSLTAREATSNLWP